MEASTVSGAASGTVRGARARLAERLWRRRAEIEQSVATRIYTISDPREAGDPGYPEALRAALAAAVEYALSAVERGEGRPPRLPPALLAQARVAAQNGIGLDTVLRRYFAGYTLVTDFIVEEAHRGGLLEGVDLKRLLRTQVTLFNRLIDAVSEEHGKEVESEPGSAEARRMRDVEELLAGERLDAARLTYELDAHHLGLLAVGEGASEAIRDLAKALGCRLLLLRRGDGTVWAWLGGRRPLDPVDLERAVGALPPSEAALSVGEPGSGFTGWRTSHRQARAALPVALRSTPRFARYAEVALLASMLQDELLVTSLRRLYLAPLEDERDGGKVLRQTLRAYFTADRNVSSAAAALGVNRQTIANRIRAVERRIGRRLNSCCTELEVALDLNRLTSRNAQQDHLGFCSPTH